MDKKTQQVWCVCFEYASTTKTFQTMSNDWKQAMLDGEEMFEDYLHKSRVSRPSDLYAYAFIQE